MSFSPPGWPVTAREIAATVAEGEGPSLRGTGGPGRPAEVEDLAVGSEDGGDDPGVAREPPNRGGGEFAAVGKNPGAEAGGEPVVVDGDDELGALPAGGGQVTGGEGMFGDLDEGIGEALTTGSLIVDRLLRVL